MAGVTFIKNKCKTMSRVLRKVVINHRIVLTLSVWGRPSMGQPPKSTFTQQNPILNTQYIYCLHSSYVRVVIETYLGAMQYVKTRSVHMDSEVHLAEGRCDKVSISYQVQLNKVNELLTLFLPAMGSLFDDLTRDFIANNFVIDIYCRCLSTDFMPNCYIL